MKKPIVKKISFDPKFWANRCPTYTFWIYKKGCRVGELSCSIVEGNCGYVFGVRIYNVEDRNKGLGSLLVRKSLVWIKKKLKIKIFHLNSNKRAVRFYKRCKFVDKHTLSLPLCSTTIGIHMVYKAA